MKRDGKKRWLLSGIALMICLCLRGCYPNGKMTLDNDKEKRGESIGDEFPEHIEKILASGVEVDADIEQAVKKILK